MKIIRGYPPNYGKIKNIFNLTGREVFTYGDTVFNPDGENIPAHLEIHEEIHKRQQGKDPEEWWNRYLKDPIFRLGQEVEAYQEQYKFAKSIIKDKNELYRFLVRIASDLSGPTYGNIILFSEAIEQIKCGNRK